MGETTNLKKAILISVFLVAVTCSIAVGRTIYVDDDGPADFHNIQAAIDHSYYGDTIIIADGTYTGIGNRNIDFHGRAITVRSENGPETCIIDSQGQGRVFYFHSGESQSSVLDGLTITNGYVTNTHGAGIYCTHSSPMVMNCIFKNNTAYPATTGVMAFGGGMYVDYGSPTVTNCVFSQNSGGWGGGMCNSTGSGTIMKNCVFSKNSTQRLGGGMFNSSGNPNITNCVFSENSGGSGGAIYNSRCSPTFTNCMLSGNSASYDGGGMCNNESSPRLTNCTISRNNAGYGDGIYNDESSPSLTNCILWGNSGEQIENETSTPYIIYSNVQGGWTGEGNINADPHFVAPQNDDYHLLPTSPCMDAGDNAAVNLTTDVDGNARIVNGIVDMGAYEHQGPRQTRLLYVDWDAWGENDGSSWVNAFWQLQDALDVALTGDEILVAQGFYNPGIFMPPPPPPPPPLPPPPPIPPPPPQFFDRTATFQLKKGVVIKGGYAGFGEPDPNARDIKVYETILTGDLFGNDEPNFVNYEENSYHVVTGSDCDESAVLDGFTITAGYANGSGNPDDSGGGMYSTQGSPTIINCTFSKNAAGYAGGMANRYFCSPTLINCTFIGNSVHSGGAGMFDWHSDSTLINCNFSGNFGRYGAAMQIYDSSSTLTNCTFSGNFAREQGGALYVSFSSVELSNCSVTSNVAGLFYGGGIYNRDGSSSLFLTNCVLFNNSDSGGMDESAQIHGGTPVVNYCCIQGWTGTWTGLGNTGSDPMFVRNPDDGGDGWGVGNREDFGALLSIGSNDDFGDLHLLMGSPCIDTGDPNYVAEPNETDLDGNLRVIGGRIDMGAYELQNTPPVADAGADQIVECECNTEGGTKVILDGTDSYDADGDVLTYTWTGSFVESPVDGDRPTITLDGGCPGEYVITLVVNDGIEDSEPDEVVITVVDTTWPEFELSVSPMVLWPPNHKMVEITPSWTVSDECDASPDVSLVSIGMNEDDNSKSDGNTNDDIEIGDDGTIYLRAERDGTGDFRIYTVTYQAVDDCGNVTVRSSIVIVPHELESLARMGERWLWRNHTGEETEKP